MDTVDTIVFLLVVGARFGVPLLIPRFPLPAIIAALVIDAADQTIFDRFTDIDQTNYQSYDKALDIYYLTIAYLSVIRNWTNGFAVEVARFLWYYRLVGVVLFELLQDRWLLFVFPNTFEYYFIAYEVVRLGWDPRRLTRRAVIAMAAVIWVFVKLPQEWWIHIAQNDFTDFMKETVFGVAVDDSWSSAVTNRPVVTVGLLLGLAAIAVALSIAARRLPPRDWPLTVDADRAVAAPAAMGHDDEPELRWPTVEKILLITLVSIIFGQLLQLGASNLQVLAAVAVVVVLNAAISVWLARRGTEWRSVGVEFAVLSVVNAFVLGVFASVVSDGGINRGASIFFGMLLTLIIVMYDRFRGERLARRPAAAPPFASGNCSTGSAET